MSLPDRLGSRESGRKGTTMMTVAIVSVFGMGVLSLLLSAEARAAEERELVGAMESVLCAARSCDAASAVAEG
jgi:hypothetical protein